MIENATGAQESPDGGHESTDGESEPVGLAAWNPSAQSDARTNRCNNCGNVVHGDLGRVLGRDDGQVERCFGCASNRQLVRGAAAGQETDEPRSVITRRGGGVTTGDHHE